MSAYQDDTVDRCLERIRTAWDAGDAAAFAAQFTEDATYVIWSGDPLMGPSEIERVHINALRRGTRMKIKVLSINPLTDDVAIVLTAVGVGKDKLIHYGNPQTLTMIRRSERWLCTAFQNTDMNPRVKSLSNSSNEV